MYDDSTLDEFTDFSWKVDARGVYIYVSGEVESILGYKAEDILGKTPFDFMTKEEAKRVRAVFSQIVLDKANIKNLENWAITSTGERICWLTNGKPVYDKGGAFQGYVGVDKNITNSKLLEENLQAQQTLLLQQKRMAQMGEMLSMIAHQWKQPLSAISTTAIMVKIDVELHKYDLNNPQQREEHLQKLVGEMDSIHDYIKHLTTTLDDFRNFFSPNKKLAYTTLESLFENSLSIIGTTLHNHSIFIKKEFLSTQEVEVHNSEIIQVILNILKNMLSIFREREIENPTITVKTVGTTIEIEDNAGGIDSDIIDYIFEKYFTTHDETQGSGLGLFMSRVIVEEHHKGILRVENVNEGVKFVISLPAAS